LRRDFDRLPGRFQGARGVAELRLLAIRQQPGQAAVSQGEIRIGLACFPEAGDGVGELSLVFQGFADSEVSVSGKVRFWTDFDDFAVLGDGLVRFPWSRRTMPRLL
jgi:hypothetical protein